MREILAMIGGLVLLVCVMAGIGYGAFLSSAFYAPRYEAIRRETVEQSKTFRDGSVRVLRDYQARYLHAANDGERAALKGAIEVEMNSVDEDALPRDLQAFVAEVRRS